MGAVEPIVIMNVMTSRGFSFTIPTGFWLALLGVACGVGLSLLYALPRPRRRLSRLRLVRALAAH